MHVQVQRRELMLARKNRHTYLGPGPGPGEVKAIQRSRISACCFCGLWVCNAMASYWLGLEEEQAVVCKQCQWLTGFVGMAGWLHGDTRTWQPGAW
jgi:hypothetical protein